MDQVKVGKDAAFYNRPRSSVIKGDSIATIKDLPPAYSAYGYSRSLGTAFSLRFCTTIPISACMGRFYGQSQGDFLTAYNQ
jgi:hypothetical protein